MGYKENKARYEPLARKLATQYGIDPNLFAAQIEQESGWDPKAGSSAGAQGIAQIIPETAKGWGVKNVWDPEEALNAAAKNMSNYIKTYKKNTALNPNGDYLTAHKLALAAYNAGPGAVQKYKGIPKYRETQDYVTRISKAFKGNINTQEGLSLGKDYNQFVPQNNQRQPREKQLNPQNPAPSRNLHAVDQLATIGRSLMNRNNNNIGSMQSLYPNPDTIYQTHSRTIKDPDLLGVQAQKQYADRMSNLESTLAGTSSTKESNSLNQQNLFNNAIQAMSNTWGTPKNNFNMPLFKPKKSNLYEDSYASNTPDISSFGGRNLKNIRKYSTLTA